MGIDPPVSNVPLGLPPDARIDESKSMNGSMEVTEWESGWPWLVGEVLEAERSLRRPRPGLRGFWRPGGPDSLRDQLADGDIPLHLADRDDGRLLARVKLDDAAGPVV